MGGLGETVNYVEDHSITSRWGKTGYKVQGNVGPWTTRDRQGTEQARAGLVGGLIPGADGAGCYKRPSILVHGWPPEASLEE